VHGGLVVLAALFAVIAAQAGAGNRGARTGGAQG
jgi:hypothetical protein